MAYSSVSYSSLLDQCAQNKAEALKLLIDTEAPYFLALANASIQQQTIAENIVKDSFVLIWKHAEEFDTNMGSARAWLYGILRYRIQHQLKQNPSLAPSYTSWPPLHLSNLSIKDKSWITSVDSKNLTPIAYAYLCNATFNDIAKQNHTSMHQCQQIIDDSLLQICSLYTNWRLDSEKQIILLGNYCLGLLREPEESLPAHQLLSSNANAPHDLLRWEHLFSYLVYALPRSICPPTLTTRIFTELNLRLADLSNQQEKKEVVKPTLATSDKPLAFDSKTHRSPPTQSQSVQAILQQSQTIKPAAPSNTKPTVSTSPKPSTPSTQSATTSEAAHQETTIAKTNSLATRSTISRMRPWHWGALCSVLLLSAALVWLVTPKAPIVQLVQMAPRAGAIMQAPGLSATPGWVVSLDSSGHVLFSPQVSTELRADQSVQLWTQAPNSTELRSLGLIDPNQPVTVPAELIGDVQVGQLFEMTLEPAGGATQPSSNVLFIGKIVHFGEFQSNSNQSAI